MKNDTEFPKLPEHSTIRRIYFCENPPNPAGAYPGSWWIMSWDGNGRSVETEDHYGVGNAQFEWHEKALAEQWLRRLQSFCPGAATEYLISKRKPTGVHGIFRKN